MGQVGAPAGAAIFRDHRVWHGGTPNVSDEVRLGLVALHRLPSTLYQIREHIWRLC